MPNDAPQPEPGNAPTPLEESLVAYLDGELGSEESRRIEELLSADPRARSTLERLERTWRLLDSLGRSEVDEQFTQTTLELVTVAAEDDVRRWRHEGRRWPMRRWLLGTLSALAAGVVGFVSVAALRPDPNRQLLENLPVIEDLDEYRQIDAVEFLRLLHQEGLFGREVGDES